MIQTVDFFVLGAFPALRAGNRALRGSAIAPAAALRAAAATHPSNPLRDSVCGTFLLKRTRIFFKVDRLLSGPTGYDR
jgi:hypothetical protein